MFKTILTISVICLVMLSSVASDTKKSGWKIDSNNKTDGIGHIQSDAVELLRSKAGYMLRAFKDVKVEPNATYTFSYKIKVEGEGTGKGLVYLGNKAGKWDEKNIKYAPQKGKCDFTEVKLTIKTNADTVKFRLDLRIEGANTKVIYKDIKFQKIAEK